MPVSPDTPISSHSPNTYLGTFCRWLISKKKRPKKEKHTLTVLYTWLYLLCCKLMCAHRDAVDKLHGAPEAVELHTLVNMHHTVGGRRPAPHAVLQEAAYACQDDFKHGEATAETLFSQQVSLTGNGNLLGKRTITLLHNTMADFVPS